MSEPASISTGIAARYATALFELAKEDKGLKALEADATALADALAVSPELVAMIGSPVVTRDEQAAAIAASAQCIRESRPRTVGGSRRRRNARRRVNR